jgi:hypothetical protein
LNEEQLHIPEYSLCNSFHTIDYVTVGSIDIRDIKLSSLVLSIIYSRFTIVAGKTSLQFLKHDCIENITYVKELYFNSTTIRGPLSVNMYAYSIYITYYC